MINFIKLILFLGILYLSVSAISYYDTKIFIEIYSYEINVSFFLVCGSIILFSVLVYGIIILIRNLYAIPRLIALKFQESQNQKAVNMILESYMYLLSNRKISDAKVNALKKMAHYKDHGALIVLHHFKYSVNHFEDKISSLEHLSKVAGLSLYTYMQFTMLFFESKNYTEALKYAKLTFDMTTESLPINVCLARIYIKLEMWQDFALFMDCVANKDYQIPDNTKVNREFAVYLYKLAEYFIQKGDNSKAIKYLEYSLKYDQANLYSIDKLCKHYINNGQTNEIQDVLDSAFACNPSFDLFVMYKKFSGVNDDAIYDTLATLARPKENTELFLAIAAALGQADKVHDIRNLNYLEN